MLQHLVTRHGDHLLQTVRHLSQKLNLSLDGEASLQTANARKVHPITIPNQQRKLSSAKFEAWKMWHEDGLSIQKIAVRLHKFLKHAICMLTILEFL